VVPDASFAFAMHYFTGSKNHNIRVRQRALDRGLSLNEYGLAGSGRVVACENETELFAALDLPYIPPELREDAGEFDGKPLPRLIELTDLKGVFHNHTTYSDGIASLRDMAEATRQLGMEYYGAGDHSQSLRIANGMRPERVREQWAEIDQLNSKLRGVRIIKGIESDILPDGSLDYDDDLLAGFDYVVVSVHTHFNLSMEEQTERICKALAHPAATMLGHATGRLLLRREAYQVDLDAVIAAAARYGKMIEINACPIRLDLDHLHIRKAKKLGVPLVINPDAHAPAELANVRFGINEARRGWLEATDVFNTRGYDEVMAELRRRKK
jgi:DNA polymerase (family X)